MLTYPTSSSSAPEVATDAPILVVDPDNGDRGFAHAVLRRAGFRVESFADGLEALEAARLEPPRLVVMEVRLGGISGYEVCRELRETYGDGVGVVFLAGDRTDSCDRVAGLLLGADDYLAKPLTGDELLARVRAVVRRAGITASAPVQAGTVQPLTKRELEVLQLLADGLDQGAIARQLFITPKTVSKHIEHILRKLPARSRAEAVAIAYQRGLHLPGARSPVAW